MYIAKCDVCGDLTLVEDEYVQKLKEEQPDAATPSFCRCALVRDMDDGQEQCPGTVVLIGQVRLYPLDFNLSAEPVR